MNLQKGDSFPLTPEFDLETAKISGTKLQAKVVGIVDGRAHLWVTKNGIRLTELDGQVKDGKLQLENHK